MQNKKRLNPTIKYGRFYNNNKEGNKRFFSDYLYMVYSFIHEIYIFIVSLTKGKSRLPKNYDSWVEKSQVNSTSIEPAITWIGHASFLIQIGGVNILTDPIFGNSTVFFPRILPPGIEMNNLPKIDFVIISHNHPDHMDSTSLIALKKLNEKIKILVPKGDKKWFLKRGFKNVHENLWWKTLTFDAFKEQVKFTFLPAYHWSQRGIFDQNRSLWGSWMIQYGQNSIYFAGDTGYSHHFKEIAKDFNKIDIALMPVGPCEPRHKMCHSHLSSEEAGDAFLDLKATHFIPMHWGTFHFGTDTFDLPIIRLKNWWNKHSIKLNGQVLNLLKFGQKHVFNIIDPETQTNMKELSNNYRNL